MIALWLRNRRAEAWIESVPGLGTRRPWPALRAPLCCWRWRPARSRVRRCPARGLSRGSISKDFEVTDAAPWVDIPPPDPEPWADFGSPERRRARVAAGVR